MAAKSIIEIDVDDEKFQAFLSAYDQYQQTLKDMPSDWRAVTDASARAGEPLKQSAGDAEQMASAFRESVATNQQLLAAITTLNAGTSAVAGNSKSFRRDMSGAKKFLDGGATAAKKIASNIKDATLSLLKWGSVVGFFSGLAGAGGLFGINRMAQTAAMTRFTALGLGTTAGGLNSSAVNYQRALGNPAGTLGAIRDAQTDLSRRWAFDAMGIRNASNADPAQLLPQMIKNARDIFTRSGSTQQGAEANGLTQFFSVDDLKRFQNMSNAEIDSMARRADADSRQMQISDDLLRKWQDFTVQVDRSSVSIRSAFISGLAPLEPQLERLSGAVSDFISAFLKSPQFGQWMDAAAAGIERFANYVMSPSFESDARRFLEVIGDLTKGIGRVASWIADKFGGGDDYSSESSPSAPGGSEVERPKGLQLAPSLLGTERKAYFGADGLQLRGGPVSERNNNPLNLRYAPGADKRDGFAAFQSPEDGFRAAARQMQRYASGQTFGTPVNTVRDIVSKWAPPSENDTEAYIRNVVKRTGFKENDKLDLNNTTTMAKLLQAMSKQENHTSNYSSGMIKIAIENNTGGNAIVSAAQLVGQ